MYKLMIAYFDCYSGIAGDMVLGAMLDAGLPFAHLKRELKKLPLRGYELKRSIERRGVVGGVNLQVIYNPPSPPFTKGGKLLSPPFEKGGTGGICHHTTFKYIRRMINSSKLSQNVKDVSIQIFETLARAEAHVHRAKIDDVHFHEVGATDSIVDIVGVAIGFDYFKFDKIFSSPLPVILHPLKKGGHLSHPPLKKGGRGGFIKCAHGNLPIPAPATLEILKGVPLTLSPVVEEIVTPTGAAIIKTVASDFCENPIRKILGTGYGLGDKDLKDIPNGLRLVLGEGERIIVIEANIDDMNPQIFDHLIELLLKNGAIDVAVFPALMKKRRPASVLQVLCLEGLKDRLCRLIFKESTTIGVRTYPVDRRVLERETKRVRTRYGTVRVKVSRLDGEMVNISPEYEDCKKLAIKKNVPLKEILRVACHSRMV